jgi:hypothetical protein
MAVGVVGAPAWIRTRRLPNTGKKIYVFLLNLQAQVECHFLKKDSVPLCLHVSREERANADVTL